MGVLEKKILKARPDDSAILAQLGRQTFIESHGHSASKADIDTYVARNYTEQFFVSELADEKNTYNLVFIDGIPAGFSKVIFNHPHPSMPVTNVTKLERLYILKDYYDLKLGASLYDFNLGLSKAMEQKGMWLFVWKENARAIRFYERNGFKIIGSHDFKISETHSNPNHLMYLEF